MYHTGSADVTFHHLIADTNSRHGLMSRFWAKVDTTAACWVWTAARAKFGHGLFWAGDGLIQAHRAAWVMENGPIPAGVGVLHRCDNPPCVRASHLYLGSGVDNARDSHARGRYGRRATQESQA